MSDSASAALGRGGGEAVVSSASGAGSGVRAAGAAPPAGTRLGAGPPLPLRLSPSTALLLHDVVAVVVVVFVVASRAANALDLFERVARGRLLGFLLVVAAALAERALADHDLDHEVLG